MHGNLAHGGASIKLGMQLQTCSVIPYSLDINDYQLAVAFDCWQGFA